MVLLNENLIANGELLPRVRTRKCKKCTNAKKNAREKGFCYDDEGEWKYIVSVCVQLTAAALHIERIKTETVGMSV